MPNPVLFLVQIDIEGPGRLVQVLEQRSIPWQQCNLFAGESLPDDVAAFSAVVPLGGPMNVYEEEKYPFLSREDFFLKAALVADVPILGVCLGAQLLAKAADARVMANSVPEIGWMRVKLNRAGQADPLFKGLDEELPVFQ